MIARQDQIDSVVVDATLTGVAVTDAIQFSKAMLNIAAEVEAAESAIRQEILRAANMGDCARVTAIVTALLSTPPGDVVRELGIQPHMPCFMPPE